MTGAEFAHHAVLSTLIVSGWTKPSRRRPFQFDSFKKAVEGQVEVEPRLLSVGDHVQPGGGLIRDGNTHGIVDEFFPIGLAKFRKVVAGKLKPARKGIASNDSGAQWMWLHIEINYEPLAS